MIYAQTDKVLMSLGGFKFKISKTAYSTLTQKTSVRWEEIKRLGGKSILHFQGFDSDTIDIDGTIYTAVAPKDGPKAFDDLKLEALKGLPLVMVDAMGKNHGKWVIVSVEKIDTAFLPNGLPRKIDFKLSLRSYE